MRASVLVLAIGCYGAGPPDVDTDAGADSDTDSDADTDVVVDTGETTPRFTADTWPGSTAVTGDTSRIHSADTGSSATSDSGGSTSDSGCDVYDDVLYCGYNCGPGQACIACLSIADSDSDSGHEIFVDYFCYPCGGMC